MAIRLAQGRGMDDDAITAYRKEVLERIYEGRVHKVALQRLKVEELRLRVAWRERLVILMDRRARVANEWNIKRREHDPKWARAQVIKARKKLEAGERRLEKLEAELEGSEEPI